MRITITRVLILVFINTFFSCQTKDVSGLFSVSVEPDSDTPLNLSEITDSIRAIELEMTDESLIGAVGRLRRLLYVGDYIIVCASSYIMLFDGNGKYVRRISAPGQGPGEFAGIWDIASDNVNRRVFIVTRTGKIMSYDFDGHFLKESTSGRYMGVVNYLNFVDGKLFYLAENVRTVDGRKMNQTRLFTIDSNLRVSDSVEVRMIHSDWGAGGQSWSDYLTYDGADAYFYYTDLYDNPTVFDTLYRFEDSRLVPHLKLNVKRGSLLSGEKSVNIYSLYRNSRYVFAVYRYGGFMSGRIHFFCGDTQTGKSYNLREGYTDDVYTGKKINFRPFASDANMFYYLHTNIDNDATEEPNPTLYIGYLKK